MTGLNLETFLHLLRADFGAWATLGLIALVLALMAWTSWGSRRALRKCLVLSVIAHFGLALYGGTVPVIILAMRPEGDDAPHERIRQIKVVHTPDDLSGRSEGVGGRTGAADGNRGAGALSRWDKTLGGLALADSKLTARDASRLPDVPVRPGGRAELKTVSASPETRAPELSNPESRPADPGREETTTSLPPRVSPGAEDDVAAAVVARRPEPAPEPVAPSLSSRRLRADRPPSNPSPDISGPRRPSGSGDLPDSPTPRSVVSAPAVAPEPIAPRLEPPTAVAAHEPAATDLGSHEVAPAEVIVARPQTTRLSAGNADLRANARSRPGSTVGGGSDSRPSTRRPPLAMALRNTPPLEGPAVAAPPSLAERPKGPAGGEGVNGVSERPAVEPRPASPREGDLAAAPVVKDKLAPLPRVAPPESDVRRRSRPAAGDSTATDLERRRATPSAPLALARVTPDGVPALPEIRGASGGRPLLDVPEVYRSRLDPNRSALAYRAGASPESEQAVERALDWLARHQDTDGRWDGATAKYDDGTAVKGDDDFTVHCPPGETCFGECVYWEADTALTGLALLSYLGAGYTQTDGKYAETVGKGLDFLLANQKPDGDLRGKSRAVGMYCHAMAAIALCEAYALTGDERLRAPVERAVGFLVRSRARDGLAWRYTPGASVGDTSILGWVVMALKSAREVGITVPGDTQAGTLSWLSKVATGEANGLARYQPWDNVTPTMTAEAWVCRQFLGAGGPGPASTEAATYLLSHGPKSDPYNLYYWYYGTLAMYQHGGDAWYRWNGSVRDEITRRQIVRGHAAGSWAPDDSPYGAKGGRIYCTALATLSLEVYYRYLRLYDEPKIPPAIAPRPRGGDRDPALGRLGNPSRPARGNTSNVPKR